MVGEVRFFESEPSQPRDGGERRERFDEWWTRPALLLPGDLESDFVVASTSEVAVVAHGIACYPTGFHFLLETVTRYAGDHASDGEDYGDLLWGLRRGDELPPELLRFGVSYSDGQKATTLDAADAMDDFEGSASSERPGLRLVLGGGGGRRRALELQVLGFPASARGAGDLRLRVARLRYRRDVPRARRPPVHRRRRQRQTHLLRSPGQIRRCCRFRLRRSSLPRRSAPRRWTPPTSRRWSKPPTSNLLRDTLRAKR
jgi:hypothetical protein